VTNWPAIWAVFAGGLVAGAYLTKVAPAIPGLRDELGLTLVESGFVATMFNLMGMLVGMPTTSGIAVARTVANADPRPTCTENLSSQRRSLVTR